jgi:eukaryotic-like serine/threonine-protein kinase
MTHRSADLYGLGSLLYELTTGQGISSVAIFPRSQVLHADLALPDTRRSLQYRARHDDIRTWIHSALAIAESGIPRAIRLPTVELIQQLCDPDPLVRFPKVVGKKRKPLPGDLNWLLRRTDILTKTLRNAEAQRIYENRRRASS